ncbi:hypothetical protein [Methylobacter sp.]|uniref:hypothetical protein n=1 Tax=Methylobacter sp. TaxID=2051955 RepID=UPI002FDE80C5
MSYRRRNFIAGYVRSSSIHLPVIALRIHLGDLLMLRIVQEKHERIGGVFFCCVGRAMRALHSLFEGAHGTPYV